MDWVLLDRLASYSAFCYTHQHDEDPLSIEVLQMIAMQNPLTTSRALKCIRVLKLSLLSEKQINVGLQLLRNGINVEVESLIGLHLCSTVSH